MITTGGKQYFVKEGETLAVELLKSDKKKLSFDPLLVIKGDVVTVGQPLVEAAVVSADVVESDKKAEKVTAIRYKPKKRVHKLHGHRQHHSLIKITKIA
ncbi:MAG: 50S ribosomal protein L21 [Candidatus Saccharimonadales bacterium]